MSDLPTPLPSQTLTSRTIRRASGRTSYSRSCRNIGNDSRTRSTVSAETSTARTPAATRRSAPQPLSGRPARSAPRTPAASGSHPRRTCCSRSPAPLSMPATAPSCARPAPRTSRPAGPAAGVGQRPGQLREPQVVAGHQPEPHSPRPNTTGTVDGPGLMNSDSPKPCVSKRWIFR